MNQDRATGDDVTRALWFHLEGFYGATDEVEDVRQQLDEIESLSTRQTIELPFRTGNERKRKEKALYRLLRIGVISDYAVEFGSGKFRVTVEPFDFEDCKKRLLEYIFAAQPAKSKLLARELDSIIPANSHHAAYELARVLIEFIYDVIERSRRRMIQESVLLARRADNDGEIRSRLLDYLQEGLGAERISELLDQRTISLANWYELVDKCQTPVDAGELRGLCIRALETYPDHPGLLLARASAEAMCSDHDDGVSLQGIGAAIRGSILDYELTQTDVQETIESLFDLALTRASELGVSLVIALLGLDDTGLAFAVDKGLARAKEFNDERVRTAVADQRMRRTIGSLEHAIGRLSQQYKRPGVLEALKGA